MLLWVIGLVAYLCFSGALAWILLIKPETVAEKIGIVQTDAPTLWRNREKFWMGIKLIGVYIFIQSAPSFIWAIFTNTGVNLAFGFWATILAKALQLVFSLWLIFRTEQLLSFLTKHETGEPL